MPPKRTSSGSPAAGPPPVKQVKAEHLRPEDFSDSVRKKLNASNRTGQACDRCKIRKMRCDGTIGGCTPCLQANTDCRTTDRITGRAVSRGYVDQLEQRLRDAESRARDLQSKLVAAGVDSKPAGYPDPHVGSLVDWNASGPDAQPTMWDASQTAAPAAAAAAAPAAPSVANTAGPAPQAVMTTMRTHDTSLFALPTFRTAPAGDNYLGVTSSGSGLSGLNGTALSILGMEIDVADFSSSDVDEPLTPIFQMGLYNKSYQSFLQSSLGINPRLDEVKLPPRDDANEFIGWYLRVLNPYLPILHGPSFRRLVDNMYEDPNFRPSAAEIVMVHMVFAIMFFQWASRNWAAPTAAEANHRSNMHYHHSLTFYGQLLASRKLVDIQALALICSHMRNFPKPSASWVVTASTFNVALEAGLHRSVKRHGPTTPPTTPPTNMIEIEMRKRVFYSLLAIHVSLSGKLGRPMPLRNEDFDVELPVAVDDDLITEEGIDRSRPGRCKILIGIEVFKAAIIFIDMFSTMYSARRDPSCYRHDVHRFEAKIAQWRDQWPSELVNVEAPVSEGDDDCSHFALYLQLWEHEFRMLVRHPSLSATRDPDFNRENIDSCLEAARGMMKTLMQVQEMKSLDTTWYNAAVYMMALMVMLYAHWYRRSELTPAALAKLREEMEDWVTIMGDVGLQIGSGTRLRDAVRGIIDGVMDLMVRDQRTRAVAPPDRPNDRDHDRSPGPSPSNFNGQAFPTSFQGSGGGTNGSMTGSGRGNGYLPADGAALNSTGQTTFQPTGAYSYPAPSGSASASAALSYPPDAGVYTGTGYPAPDGSLATNTMTADAAGNAATAAAADPQRSNGAVPFGIFTNGGGGGGDGARAAQTESAFQTNDAMAAGGTHAAWNPGSTSWRQWTGAISNNLEPQECFSASALMQLGGRDLGAAGASGGTDATTNISGTPVVNMSSGSPANADATAAAAAAAVAAAASGEIPPEQQTMWPLMIVRMGSGSTPA